MRAWVLRAWDRLPGEDAVFGWLAEGPQHLVAGAALLLWGGLMVALYAPRYWWNRRRSPQPRGRRAYPGDDA